MKNVLFITLILASHIVLSGCTDKGELEKTGERADEIIENVKEGESPLHKKGPMEKAGEKVDETIKDVTK